MQTFTDATGRVWSLRLDWQAMRRAKAAGVDLSKIEESLPDLYRCGVELSEAVWACLDLRGGAVNRDEFESALVGDAMEAARDALLQAVIDFFPEHRRRLIAGAIADVRRQMAELEALAASVTPRPSEPSTGSPASSA